MSNHETKGADGASVESVGCVSLLFHFSGAFVAWAALVAYPMNVYFPKAELSRGQLFWYKILMYSLLGLFLGIAKYSAFRLCNKPKADACKASAKR